MKTGADSSQNRGARRGRLDAGRDAHREAGDIGFDLPPQRALRPTADDGQSPHIEAGVSHRLQDVAQRERAAFEQRAGHMRLAVRQRESVKDAARRTVPFGGHRALHARQENQSFCSGWHLARGTGQ